MLFEVCSPRSFHYEIFKTCLIMVFMSPGQKANMNCANFENLSHNLYLLPLVSSKDQCDRNKASEAKLRSLREVQCRCCQELGRSAC